VVDFDKLVEFGVISPEDLDLFHLTDDVDDAFNVLTSHLTEEFAGKKQYWHW
jgi:hypothetical protein